MSDPVPVSTTEFYMIGGSLTLDQFISTIPDFDAKGDRDEAHLIALPATVYMTVNSRSDLACWLMNQAEIRLRDAEDEGVGFIELCIGLDRLMARDTESNVGECQEWSDRDA